MQGLLGHAGTHIGYTEWAEMTQERVDEFADVTGDHNFIHVDPERAKQTPFGGTIAHGLLSLSLLVQAAQLVQVSDATAAINYGLNKVRFPAPVPVGAEWRGGAEIAEVSEARDGVQVMLRATLEVKGSERPGVVAEFLIRYQR